MRKSLLFSKLQRVKFWAIKVGAVDEVEAVEDVDQEILDAARKIIPKIVIE